MNIRDLAATTQTAERQIRYLISEGFVPPPRGGRAHADYGDDHVAAIRRYSRLRDLGFPPAAIKLLLEAREGAPFTIVPGITLVIDPNLFGSGMDPAPLAKDITRILTDILEETAHERDHAANDR